MKNSDVPFLAFPLFSLFFSHLAIAQINIDESDVERIIVTSDLSNKTLDEIEASVTVLDFETLDSRQARHIEDVMFAIPNTNFASGASRGKFIQIRGIGERSQFSEPVNPSVALVLDDIDFSGLGALATLFDIEQIEVLAGPQSTSTGASGLAGMVKLVSTQPSREATGKAELSLADYNTRQIAAAYSSGLSQNVNARVAIQQFESDGFVENTYLNRKDTNNINELSARLSVDYFYSSDLMAKLRLYHFDIDNGYDAFSLDNDNFTLSDQPGNDITSANAMSMNIIKELEKGRVSVVFSQLDSESDYAYDEDWTFVGFHPDGYQSTDRYLRDINAKSLDANFKSESLILGLLIKSTEENLIREYTFSDGDFTSNYKPSSQALYGEYRFQVDVLELTLGARLENFKADYFDITGFTESLDDSLFAGKLSVSYDLDEAVIFGSISRGYKAGGFNPDQRVRQQDRLFEPEYNWNHEIGFKSRVDSIDASFRITAFYMNRKDAQVSDFSILPRNDGSGAVEFLDVIGNADTGINKGLEVKSDWQVAPKLALTMNLGYLDATFGGYQRVDGSLIPKQEQAQAPKWTFHIASTMKIFDEWSWVVQFEGKDTYRFSDGHQEKAPVTTILNTDIRYEMTNWTAKLWIKNVLDRDVYTRGFGGFSNDPRDGYFPAEPYYQFGQERQIGLTFSYRFGH